LQDVEINGKTVLLCSLPEKKVGGRMWVCLVLDRAQ
jgi:hypothetical protein